MPHSWYMMRAKSTPRKVDKRRVALLPAPEAVSSPPFMSGTTPGLETYQKAIDRLEQKYGAGQKATKKKRTPRRRKKVPKSPEFVITPADERLIEAATQLQHRSKQKHKRLRNTKAPVKRTGPKTKASLGFDRRTTLLSLVRRIPDAKNPSSNGSSEKDEKEKSLRSSGDQIALHLQTPF